MLDASSPPYTLGTFSLATQWYDLPLFLLGGHPFPPDKYITPFPHLWTLCAGAVSLATPTPRSRILISRERNPSVRYRGFFCSVFDWFKRVAQVSPTDFFKAFLLFRLASHLEYRLPRLTLSHPISALERVRSGGFHRPLSLNFMVSHQLCCFQTGSHP